MSRSFNQLNGALANWRDIREQESNQIRSLQILYFPRNAFFLPSFCVCHMKTMMANKQFSFFCGRDRRFVSCHIDSAALRLRCLDVSDPSGALRVLPQVLRMLQELLVPRVHVNLLGVLCNFMR